ncbi:defective chorion-1 protein, FC125 isoform isoform X2 [Drosophila elegans]|uniref:defective chorion-1 protein, FC125 isoform isoform X2 n=1 Tax=Drosophila elegans TaxID=30023 RepID=UPI0007E8809E|nr:defective chorion-1 protein, FC125 isoform isoform X2 [Drosophila elegans]
MRLHRLLPLLALLGVHVSCQCPGQAIVGSGLPAPDGESTTNSSTDTRLRFPSQDEILGQMPPIAPIRTGSPQMDAFYMIFPALSSIFRWSSLFPAQSLLGAFSDNMQPAAAASKVVLVLADDATAKTRVTRQNPPQPNPFGQMMSWPQDFGFRPENFALPNIDMGPQVGSFLAQMPPLPGLLGAAAPGPVAAAADPPAPAADPAPPAPPAAVAAADPPAADAPQVPFLLGQSLQNAFNSMTPPNLDMSTLLSQAMSPLPNLSQALPPLPNLGQAMPPLPNLGQAMPPLPNLGQAMPPLPNLGQAMPPLPNLGQAAPSTLDFVAQMQRQFFPGMTPVAQATPAAGTDAQSSDISEVRVRPEVAHSSEAEMAHQKIKSTMEREREQVPLLWFRMPSTQKGDATEEKSVDDLRVEAKLRAFERQVIAELKMLQKIELMAKEMRASADGEATGYRLNYPLSRTPVHKITRADIEQALRDDYVRRLVAKEAQRKTRTLAQPGARQASGLKRQAKIQDQTMSKEDIVQIMAYAYRMASEQMEGEKGHKDKVYAAYRTTGRQSDPLPPTQEQNFPTRRQWSEDQATIQQIPQLQNPPMQRQMAEGPQMEQQMQLQQRQWSEEQARIQQVQQQMAQPQNAMMMQQRQSDPLPPTQEQNAPTRRQWSEDQATIQQIPQLQNPPMRRQMAEGPQMEQQMQMQQRQWSEEQARIQQAQQQMAQPQNPMMMQQRQWSEDPKVMQQMQQERQWADNQARMQQQQQQQQQRQWSEEQAKMQQDQQMAQQRMAPQNPMMMQQRQWTEEQAKMMEQQRQMAESPAQMIQQNPMMMQQQPQHQTPMMRQWANEDEAAQKWADEKAQAIQMQQEEHMVGEAGPQMPENEGIARHKVDFLGLGGDKRKKSKSHSSPPTVINYYYAAPQRPAAPSYGSSYGTTYGGGGYGSNAYGPVHANYYHGQGYRTAVGNDEVDEMLRQHQTMARTINPQPSGAVGGADSTPPPTTTGGASQEQLQPHRVHKSPSSAPSETESEIESPPPPAPAPAPTPSSDPQVGSIFTFDEGLLHPFMGLLPVARPDDPWNEKAYDPHHPLFTGGGSYDAYLKDGRRRRDTHIMGQGSQQNLLTPGMLERLLRIKMDFQRRFPHLYKGMLNHHTNLTRVEVQPPVLGKISTPAAKSKAEVEDLDEPVFELGAAERSLFEAEGSDPLEKEPQAEPDDEADDLDIEEPKESSEPRDSSSRKERDDNDIDYFNFDDDDVDD